MSEKKCPENKRKTHHVTPGGRCYPNVRKYPAGSFKEKLLNLLTLFDKNLPIENPTIIPIVNWQDARAEYVYDYHVEPAREAYRALKSRVGNTIMLYDLDPTDPSRNLRIAILRETRLSEGKDKDGHDVARIFLWVYMIRTKASGDKMVEEVKTNLGYVGIAIPPESLSIASAPLDFPVS